MKPTQLGALIKERREARGWSLAALAGETKFDISRQQVFRVEEGASTPPPERLDLLLRAVGLRLLYTVLDSENPRHMMWLRSYRFFIEADEVLITQGIGSMLEAWERQQKEATRGRA